MSLFLALLIFEYLWEHFSHLILNLRKTSPYLSLTLQTDTSLQLQYYSQVSQSTPRPKLRYFTIYIHTQDHPPQVLRHRLSTSPQIIFLSPNLHNSKPHNPLQWQLSPQSSSPTTAAATAANTISTALTIFVVGARYPTASKSRSHDLFTITIIYPSITNTFSTTRT